MQDAVDSAFYLFSWKAFQRWNDCRDYMNQSVHRKRHKWEKFLVIGVLALVIVLIFMLAWKFFGPKFSTIIEMMKRGDEEEIGTYLRSQGEWKGLLSIFVMTVLQVISIFIPGIAVQVAAGMCFGWWKAFIMTYTGFIFGHGLVFYAARRLGNRLYEILELDKKDNPLEAKVNHYSPTFVLMLAYLIPGIPNGFIPYFASRLDIRAYSFLEAVAGASWIQVLLNCIAGHFLVRGDILFMILSFALQIVVILLIYFNRNFFLEMGAKKKKKTNA